MGYRESEIVKDSSKSRLTRIEPDESGESRDQEPAAKPISLAPLSFENAVRGLSAVNPEGPDDPGRK